MSFEVKSVLEMHFPRIWRSKISSFTAHHGGTSGDTDLANSKETQSREKTGVDQSSSIKAWGGIEKDQWHEMG